MFSKIISRTPFTAGQADTVFGRIVDCDRYRDDSSFSALLRALLSKRINDDSRVSCIIRTVDAEGANMAHNMARFVDASRVDTGMTICIISVTGADESRKQYFERLDRQFVEYMQGAKEFSDLRAYVSKAVNARFYVNEARRFCCIFVDELTERRFHLLGAFIPRYLPWYFRDQPINEFEQNLLRSMMDKYAAKFESLIEEAYQKLGANEMVVRQMIIGFEKRSREIEIEQANRNLERINNDMRRTMETYRDLVMQRDISNVRIAGLMAMSDRAGDSSELVDYFVANKRLIPIDTDRSHLMFVVKTYMDMVDPEAYNSIINNSRSYINEMTVSRQEFVSLENRRLLLDALFSEEANLKLKVCAYYDLDIRGSVRVESHYDYPRECADFVPNPHLHYHACLGDHMRLITACLDSGNLIGAIEQCVASARSMNIQELATARPFISELFDGCNNKIIELPDGTSVTPVEALQWLMKQKEEVF